MSNISLGGNHGHSINFDGASLQNEQEAEYRKEEEAQQNELRALLSNAFDDLIDDDDILSITSDDGTDSRNVSLVRRHSNDSMGRPSLEDMNKNRIDEQPEQDWNHASNDLQPHPRSNQGHDPRNPNRIPQPQRAQFEPLSRTQELPRGQIDLLRASVESLPAYPSASHNEIQGHGHGNFDNHSIPSRHGSRDHLDSDYHSNAEDNAQSVEFRGHVYPLPSNQCHSQGQISRQTSHSDTRSEVSDRENTLRKSIEDFEKIQEAYQSHQLPVSIPQGQVQGHEHGFYGDSEVHATIATHQHYHDTEQTFDPGQYHYPHLDQNQVQPVHHHGYGEHYHDNPHVHHEDTHHHFRNIYADRPYHTIGERGETEGGNVVLDRMGYYHPGYDQTHVYHGNQEIDQSEQRNQECLSQQTFNHNGSDPGYFSRVKDKASTILTNTTQQIANSLITNNSGVTTGRKLPQVKYRLQNVQGETKKDHNKGNSNSNSAVPNKGQENGPSHEVRERVSEEGSYKVKYERDSGGTGSRKGDRRRVEENTEDVDKDFMDQVGSGDSQQLAQLQILYKARGRKIEELTNEMEVLKSDTGREMRILKHQLSVAKGEKQGSTKSLDSVQSLLQDARGENAQLVGRVNACESQIEGLKRGKEELIKKLQTAESTIETLHQHLEELGSSDTLTRARHDHEVVVGGLQKKYENEIKLLKENIDRLNETAQEKKEENAMLKQKLAESIKEHETAQISRAETINRLTQSLEESQKRCRNLLEASSSQEMSQMKIHLQQALAGRSISDEMCSSLQEEIQDLKEQVQMLESASNLGVSMATTHPTSSTTVFQDGNDSMADLGIKKTLDFDTPQGTPTNVKHISMIHHQHQHHSSADVVTSLKSELERCLVSNKQKRQEVTDLKEELRKVKKDMLEYKQRCERAELLTQEHKRRIADLESCINPGDKMNAIENRLKKDVENLKKEKRILLEDCEELQRRLEEVSNSEEKLTELNRELSKQISDMVKEYDMDKRQAVERAHRASEQVSETSRRKLQQELTIQFDGERSSIIARYEEEINNIREELKTAQDEIDRVKDEYCKLCEDMDKVKVTLENEHADKLDKTVAEVKESMQQEIELAKLRTEEDCDKKKEDEIKELKEEFEKVKGELSEKIEIETRESNSTALDECREENRRAIEELKLEHEKEVKAAQEKFEAEIKAMKDILDMEKTNDMDKLEKEKSNEIEKLKKVIVDKELYISEKEQLFREKDKLLAEKESMLEKFKSDMGGKSSIIESLKNEYKTNFDSFRQDLNDKSEEIEKLREELDKKIKAIEEMKSELANYEKLKEVLKCKNNELERLRTEMEHSKSEIVAEKSAEIDKLKQELSETVELKTEELEKIRKEFERVELEKDNEIDRWRKEENEKDEVEHLRKEIDKNIQKDRQVENEMLRKEVINLRIELERLETDKQSEIDRMNRIKQTEIENMEKKRKAEVEKLKKDKQNEMERVVTEKEEELMMFKMAKEEEIAKLKKGKGVADADLLSKVKDRLNTSTDGADLNRTLENKVAMSKVVWLEEHRATRQAAIENAVRLAETELKMKMEEDLKNKTEARLEEAKAQWQNDSLSMLEEERRAWDSSKEEEISACLESERQKWARELEQRLEEEKQSWREFELETEKLKWASDFERKLEQEKEGWVRNMLEPAKRKWKHDFEEKLRMEKENWRCIELETEKLSLLQEYEKRLAQEKQSWINKILPEALEKEKRIWKTHTEDVLRKNQEKWRTVDLPKEMEKVKSQCLKEFETQLQSEHDRWRETEMVREVEAEREKWYKEIEGRLREERNNWKNCDLPEEIEKERKKWMKLMEQTLQKEKENWKTKDMPEQVQRVRQDLEAEMENRLVQKLGTEKDRLQKESEAKVLEAIEEHQEACKQELTHAIAQEKEHLRERFDNAIAEEREHLKEKFGADLQERFVNEKKVWKEMVDQELSEKLEVEKEKWKRKSESDMNRKLESEKDKLKSLLNADFEKKLEAEVVKRLAIEKDKLRSLLRADFEKKFEFEKKLIREQLEEDFDEHMKNEIDRLKEKFEQDAREDFDHLKSKFDNERGEELERLRMQLEEETQMNLDKERELMHLKSDRELGRKLEQEEEKWKNDFEKELSQKLQNEEIKWKEMIEKDIEARLREERSKWSKELEEEKEKWNKEKAEDLGKTVKKETESLRQELEDEKMEEIRKAVEDTEDRLKAELDDDMEKFRVEVEQEFHNRIEHEVTMAVEESRDDWNREYMMEMSINTTSAEASQGLLKEEIENLKHQLQIVQSELQDKEKAWLKEREDIFLQKDLERRRDLENLQTKTEAEYRQFLDEHKDTLDKALKAAREQHNQDKAELEGRFDNQLKLLQVREKSLQQQLQQALDGSEDHHENLAELEKERIMWFDERDRLLQDIADRDSLLGKADVHLSKEVDKLRSELQAAYQRRLEAEMTSFRQKMESEYARVNNSEQKEKLLLEKQLSEINTELNKLKNQMHDERTKHGDEMKDMKQKLNEIEEKLEDHTRLEGELMKAKELLKGYKDELTDNQEKIEKLKSEKEELMTKLNKTSQSLDKHQTELQTKSSTLENMEASFRKDLSAYKHKLEEANNRIIKTEKHLHEMKLKYRTELESLRKALEAENDTAMNAMKNKMIELQKKHVEIVDQLKKKHLAEREQYMKGQAVSRGVTPTPNMHGDVEEIDQAVKELRSQYLDTVAKIKDDVLRHITETNVRAAETVKFEMDRERMTTFQQIKEFYRQNVRTILETELVGATLESKLLAVEEALDQLSSNPSSRSTTPKSDEFILDERQLNSRSRSASRDAGISPKGQRSVSFTSGTKGERSHTPVLNSGKDLNASLGFEDPRSPKNRIFTKSPRDVNVTLRGEHVNDNSDLWASEDWKNESMKSGSFDTRKPENRPTSARSARENRDFDTRVRENRPLSAKSPRELHMSLRQRGSEYDYNESELDRSRSDKRRSRTLISTRDIHSGRYHKTAEGEETIEDRLRYNGDSRSKSTTPMYSSLARSSPSLYRPTSVPDLSCEDKELKIWTETNNDTYRYTPLRDTLRSGTNLHRNNSKSESDLSIAEKNFAPMKGEYDSNLDLSSGSLTSDAFLTPRKARDAGETPTSTPRRHYHRKHYTLHSFPTRDQISSELRNREQSTNSDLRNQEQSHGNEQMNASINLARNNENGVNSPIAGRTSRKNLPLIQFRQGKVQGLAKMPGTSSKSPHPEDGVMMRDTPPTRDNNGTQDRPYRPLSVSSTPHMNF